MSNTTSLIGLAGLSGAGKNYAAEILEEHACAIIDADRCTHQILQEYEQVFIDYWQPVAQVHGLQLLTDKKKLNRKILGELLFSNKALLQKHEHLIFPLIEAKIRKEIVHFQKKKPPAIILNAPTLHKTSLLNDCNFVLWISAPFLFRLWRIKKRDSLSCIKIIQRFWSQKNFYAQYLKKNVDIISVSNCGTKKSLEKKILFVLRKRYIEV